MFVFEILCLLAPKALVQLNNILNRAYYTVHKFFLLFIYMAFL